MFVTPLVCVHGGGGGGGGMNDEVSGFSLVKTSRDVWPSFL